MDCEYPEHYMLDIDEVIIYTDILRKNHLNRIFYHTFLLESYLHLKIKLRKLKVKLKLNKKIDN